MFIHSKLHRIAARLLTAILCLTLLAACDGGNAQRDVTTSTAASTTQPTTQPMTVTATAPPTATATDPVVHTKTLDGIQLTVTLAKEKTAVQEDLQLTVRVTNTTQKDIPYTLHSSSENMHFEIPTAIKRTDGKAMIDRDTYGKFYTDMVRNAVLKAGESFTQTMRFVPGYASGGSDEFLAQAVITYFEAGSFSGTASFRWGNEGSAKGKTITLDFPVVIQ